MEDNKNYFNYDDFNYEFLNDGTIKIRAYAGHEETVKIPSEIDGHPVAYIDGRAFENCESLKSIIIPNSVTRMYYAAFAYCTSLTSITIPDSITNISIFAFEYCTSLESIVIPDSVTNIGDYSFRGCTSLTSITIPDSVTRIGGGAFSDCTSLTSITIPDSVTSISAWTFEDCSESLVITCSKNSPIYNELKKQSEEYGFKLNVVDVLMHEAGGILEDDCAPLSKDFNDDKELSSRTVDDELSL